MKELGERKIRWVLGGIGLGSYALLLDLEILNESDDLDLADVMGDALPLLLTVASAVGVALLVHRVHKQHEEKLSLVRDLETVRAEGEEWQNKTQAHLEGIRVEMEKQFE